MKRTLTTRLATGGAVAALALGAVACGDMETNDDVGDPGLETEGGGDLGGESDSDL